MIENSAEDNPIQRSRSSRTIKDARSSTSASGADSSTQYSQFSQSSQSSIHDPSLVPNNDTISSVSSWDTSEQRDWGSFDGNYELLDPPQNDITLRLANFQPWIEGPYPSFITDTEYELERTFEATRTSHGAVRSLQQLETTPASNTTQSRRAPRPTEEREQWSNSTHPIIDEISSAQQTGDNFYDVRAFFAKPMHDSYGPFHLNMEWDPSGFLNAEGLSAGTPARFSEVHVYCGSNKQSFATSAHDYLTWIWPSVGRKIIRCFQHACTALGASAEATIDGVCMGVTLAGSHTSVKLERISNNPLDKAKTTKLLREIAEACVWLSVSCQSNEYEDAVAPCNPQLAIISQTKGQTVIKVSSTLGYPLEESDPGLCWTGMVRNPVLAFGYPIPFRSDAKKHVGLELSFDLMLALSGVDSAAKFDGMYILKGHISALVPTYVSASAIVWHFTINKNRERMTWPQARAASDIESAETIDTSRLAETRHFVGMWTESALNMAGADCEDLYDLSPSSATQMEDAWCLSIDNVTVGINKPFTAAATLGMTRRDLTVAMDFSEREQFVDQIQGAAKLPVVFFGTNDRRAWLIDGASALLHLGRSYLASQNAKYLDPVATTLLNYPTRRGGENTALDTLMANRMTNIEYLDGGSPWSYKDFVITRCKLLHFIHDQLRPGGCHKPQFQMKLPFKSPVLIGYELNDIVSTTGGNYYAHQVTLESKTKWVKFTREQGAVVLFANTYGDLIRPEILEKGCPRTMIMDPGHDSLAVSMYMLRKLSNKYPTSAYKGRIQLSGQFWWHHVDDDSKLSECGCHLGSACEIYSGLGKNTGDKSKLVPCPSIFERHPNGAAVIGRSSNEVGRLAPSISRTDGRSQEVLVPPSPIAPSAASDDSDVEMTYYSSSSTRAPSPMTLNSTPAPSPGPRRQSCEVRPEWESMARSPDSHPSESSVYVRSDHLDQVDQRLCRKQPEL